MSAKKQQAQQPSPASRMPRQRRPQDPALIEPGFHVRPRPLTPKETPTGGGEVRLKRDADLTDREEQVKAWRKGQEAGSNGDSVPGDNVGPSGAAAQVSGRSAKQMPAGRWPVADRRYPEHPDGKATSEEYLETSTRQVW